MTEYTLKVERQTIYDERSGKDMGEATVLIPQFQPSELPEGLDRCYESIWEHHWQRPGMIVLKDEIAPEFEPGEELTIEDVLRRHHQAFERIKESIADVFETLKEIVGPQIESMDGYDEVQKGLDG